MKLRKNREKQDRGKPAKRSNRVASAKAKSLKHASGSKFELGSGGKVRCLDPDVKLGQAKPAVMRKGWRLDR